MKFLKLLLLGLILTGFITSCVTTRQQRKDNRVAKKIEKIKMKHPVSFRNVTTETVRIDTVLQEIHIAGEVQIDTVEVTEFLTEYLHDTIQVNNFITKFIEHSKDITQVDTLGIHLWIEGVGIKYDLTKDEQYIEASKDVETITITRTEVVNKIPWYIWIIVIGCIIVAVFSHFRR
jgi:hypothetical protein